jgi:putative alpha-1,2-mannosidase
MCYGNIGSRSWWTVLAAAAGMVVLGISAPPAGAAPPARVVPLVANPVPYVDPMIAVDPTIGTGNGGGVVGQVNNFPGPSVPFGMLQWSPDTAGAYAGYSYDSNQIRGFSLTHASVGCPQFGDVPILPIVGEVGTAPWNRTETFSHSSEVAKAGEYAVTLADSNVRVDMTSATRTGLAELTFPAASQAQILIKAGASLNGNRAAGLQTVGDHEVVGSATTGNFCGHQNTYTIYFALQFDRPFTAAGGWDGTTVHVQRRGRPLRRLRLDDPYAQRQPARAVRELLAVGHVPLPRSATGAAATERRQRSRAVAGERRRAIRLATEMASRQRGIRRDGR